MNFRTAYIKAADPIGYLELRCPKAARKKRVQKKKWRRRFGPRLPEIMAQMLKDKEYFLANFSSLADTSWKGAPLIVPLSDS